MSTFTVDWWNVCIDCGCRSRAASGRPRGCISQASRAQTNELHQPGHATASARPGMRRQTAASVMQVVSTLPASSLGCVVEDASSDLAHNSQTGIDIRAVYSNKATRVDHVCVCVCVYGCRFFDLSMFGFDCSFLCWFVISIIYNI